MAKKSDADLLPALNKAEHPVHLIYVKCFLVAALSAEKVLTERYKPSTCRKLESPLGVALWQAYCSLREEAERYAEALRSRGQLLFAHAGTTVLTGGAA